MELEDYKARQPKPVKKAEGASSLPSQLRSIIMLTALLSGLVGFAGGLLAIRFSPDLVTDSDSITQRVFVREGEIIADIAEDVTPSVVSITVTSLERTFNPFFGSSFESEQQGAGTGIILSEDGLVVTNDHVIPDNVSTVRLTMHDGTSYEDVRVIGREPFNDIAYLQIEDVSGLTPARLGESKSVRVGEQVIAIGNALGEFDTTVTSGIISGVGRPIIAGSGNDAEQLVNLFQTDASINPGNSGGPLLNLQGEVIGINTAVAGNAENIGFAIPIDDVKPGITSVETNGELIRPYLGVRYVTLNAERAEEFEVEQTQGALVTAGGGNSATIEGSPADKAGIRDGDVITQVNGQNISEENPLPNLVSQYQVDDVVVLTIERDGEEISLDVTLERVPDGL